jgi:hypothetical protein
MIYLQATKGYSTEENVVFLENDIVKVTSVEEGMIYLEGVSGWCKEIEMNFSPRIIAECFKMCFKIY